ncbi:MAG: hypothetical protein E4H36_14620 [Spirochaetales bacterium]|nr:MAG: hypothetical protein E4H36_14620 [Spirochaetales bacterium]
MKTVIVLLFVMMFFSVSGLFAADFLVGVSYFVDEYDTMYTSEDYEPVDLDFPFIALIEMNEDQGSAVLYYDYQGEPYVEDVSMEDNSSGDYGSFRQYAFYSDFLGDVLLYMGDEATVDDLGAVMASYRFYSAENEGMVTAVGVVAAEEYQAEDDQLDQLYSIIDDVRTGFVSEGY